MMGVLVRELMRTVRQAIRSTGEAVRLACLLVILTGPANLYILNLEVAGPVGIDSC